SEKLLLGSALGWSGSGFARGASSRFGRGATGSGGGGALGAFFGLGGLLLLLEGELQDSHLGQPEDFVPFLPAFRLLELENSLGAGQHIAVGNGACLHAQSFIDRHWPVPLFIVETTNIRPKYNFFNAVNPSNRPQIDCISAPNLRKNAGTSSPCSGDCE